MNQREGSWSDRQHPVVGGRMAQPGSGYYSATKFAVEGLSDALRK
jgi:NADP-dependent 3-hydroxy acid dehydrogenase YdfG